MGTSYQVAFEDGALSYQAFDHGYSPEPPRRVYPTEEAWRAFWDEIASQGVWAWEPEYTSEYLVCDGEQWSLELEHQGLRVASGGDNAHPGVVQQGVSLALNDLSLAFVRLTGGLEFGYVDPAELEDDPEEPVVPLTIFTFGYWGWGNHTPQLVEAFDASEARQGFAPPLFIDTRFRREVRAVGFRGDAFEKVVGKERYRWVKRLGNKNIVADAPNEICIADPTAVGELLDLAIEAAGRNQRIVFYCACEHPAWCHRRVVADMLADEAIARDLDLTVIEWPGGDPAVNTLDVAPEVVKAITKGRKSVSLKEAPAEFQALPWYSVVELVPRGGGASLPIATGPARFAPEVGWYLPVLELGKVGQAPHELLKSVLETREEYEYDAIEVADAP